MSAAPASVTSKPAAEQMRLPVGTVEREVTRDYPPGPARTAQPPLPRSAAGELESDARLPPAVIVAAPPEPKEKEQTDRYEMFEILPPAAQPPAAPASVAIGSGPQTFVDASPSAASQVSAPFTPSSPAPVAPREMKTDPGVGVPPRPSTPPPVATAPAKRVTNPRVQSLQAALGELEIEDEFDIPAFLRRHAPPPGAGNG
jgi:hypothetical protein